MQLQPVPEGGQKPQAGPDDPDQRQREADPQVRLQGLRNARSWQNEERR